MKTKRILAALLAAVTTMGALSGCGDKLVATGENELSIFMHFFGYCVYDDEWPIFKKAEELTGVKLRGVASETVSDSAQAYNTMLVSDKLPDIIHYNVGGLQRLAIEGGLIPLNDLIEEHGPNIKKFLEEYPDAKVEGSLDDGNIYFITGANSGIEKGGVPAVQKGWFIRTDWLKKLGLEVPKTVDELYSAMKAFKTQDPNGNGVADEVPMLERQEGITSYLQLFGAYFGWHENEEGRVVHGMTEDSYKLAMKELHKWYKEGLIDPEIFTRGQQSREQLFGQDIGGLTHDWFSSTAAMNDKYAESIPGFELMPMDPPADVNGVVKEFTTRPQFHGQAWGISKDCKDPVLAIKYLDFWLSEEGKTLISYGVEGVHHTVVDGKCVFTDTVLNAEEGVPTYMRNQGQVEIGSILAIDAEILGMNEIGRVGFQRYIDEGYAVEYPSSSFTTEESSERAKIMTNIDTYMKEMQQKWIMGGADIDATWDEYIQTINDMNYQRAEELTNIAYARAEKVK